MQATEEMLLAAFEKRFEKLENLCLDYSDSFYFASRAIDVAERAKTLVDELLLLAEELKKLEANMSKQST